MRAWFRILDKPSFIFLLPSRMRLLFALLAACALAPALAQPPAPTTTPASPEPFKASAPLSLELRNAQWFDGQGFKRGTLYVVDGRFVATKPKRVNRRMDLKSQFVVPPLGEAHNYNLQNDWGVSRYAQRYLQEGVFYAAMLCGEPGGVDPVRGRLNTADSPDVLFVTACVTSSDGQPLAALAAGTPKSRPQDFADRAVLVMDKPEQVEQKWSQLLARKSDAVRLVLSFSERPELRSRPELAGRLGMTPETAAALVRQSHKAGLRVIAHVDTAADFEAAVRAGVDLIDHLPGYTNPYNDAPERFQISTEAAALAARQKVMVITATAATPLFKPSAEQLAALRQIQQRNLQTLKNAGVTLLLGSDLFTDTAQAELRQLGSLNVLSPAELLRMATIDTPKALFPKRQLGCFEPGCEASFLLLAADPLQDLELLARPMLRVKQGRLLTQLDDVADASDDSTDSTDAPAKGKKSGKKSSKSGKATKKPAAKPAAKPGSAAGKKSTAAAARSSATAHSG